MSETENQKKDYYKWKCKLIDFIEKDDFKSDYYKGFIFAIKNDIYPFFPSIPEITNKDEIDLYKDFYVIKKDFILKVLSKADESYTKHESIPFYEYEVIFGKKYRDDLILVFLYAFLSKKFINFNFWSKLIDSDHNPDESN